IATAALVTAVTAGLRRIAHRFVVLLRAVLLPDTGPEAARPAEADRAPAAAPLLLTRPPRGPPRGSRVLSRLPAPALLQPRPRPGLPCRPAGPPLHPRIRACARTAHPRTRASAPAPGPRTVPVHPCGPARLWRPAPDQEYPCPLHSQIRPSAVTRIHPTPNTGPDAPRPPDR